MYSLFCGALMMAIRMTGKEGCLVFILKLGGPFRHFPLDNLLCLGRLADDFLGDLVFVLLFASGLVWAAMDSSKLAGTARFFGGCREDDALFETGDDAFPSEIRVVSAATLVEAVGVLMFIGELLSLTGYVSSAMGRRLAKWARAKRLLALPSSRALRPGMTGIYVRWER